MLVEAVFECVLLQSDVVCAVVVGTIGYVGPVNQAFCGAISSERTDLLNFAVAFLGPKGMQACGKSRCQIASGSHVFQISDCKHA